MYISNFRKMCNWSNVPIKTEVIHEDVTTPKIKADIKPKVEPCDEISKVDTRAEIQNWINQIEFKTGMLHCLSISQNCSIFCPIFY